MTTDPTKPTTADRERQRAADALDVLLHKHSIKPAEIRRQCESRFFCGILAASAEQLAELANEIEERATARTRRAGIRGTLRVSNAITNGCEARAEA